MRINVWMRITQEEAPETSGSGLPLPMGKRKAGRYPLLSILAFLYLVPVIVLIMTSLKTPNPNYVRAIPGFSCPWRITETSSWSKGFFVI
jgi:ABC-type glycerol-3-phosphate transport system permease component